MLTSIQSVNVALDDALKAASGNHEYIILLKEFEKLVSKEGFLDWSPNQYVKLLRRFQNGEFFRDFPNLGQFRKSGGQSQLKMMGMISALFSFPIDDAQIPETSFLKIFLTSIRKDRGGFNILKEVSRDILDTVNLKELGDDFYQSLLLFYLAITVNIDQPDKETADNYFKILPSIKKEVYPEIILGLRTKISNYFEGVLKTIHNLLLVYPFPITVEEAFIIYGCQAECFFRLGEWEKAGQSFEMLKEEPVKIIHYFAKSIGVEVDLLSEQMHFSSFQYNVGIELRERKLIGHVPAFIMATYNAQSRELKKLSQCSVGTGLLEYIELYDIPEFIPEAEQAFEVAMRLDPSDYITYSGLAVLNMLSNKQQNAIDFASKALKINPNAFGAKRVMSKYFS